MFDDAVRRIEMIIKQSEAQSHWFPAGAKAFPGLKPKNEREELSIACAGYIFISHSSSDSPFIEEFILPSVIEAAGKHYFMLNWSMYSSIRQGSFQHAMWVSGAIEGCKTVIVVVSANSRRSDWVKWECHTAQAQKHPIIVCLVDPTGLGSWLTDAFDAIAPFQILDFHSQPEKYARELSQTLRLPAFSVGPWNGRPLGTHGQLLARGAD